MPIQSRCYEFVLTTNLKRNRPIPTEIQVAAIKQREGAATGGPVPVIGDRRNYGAIKLSRESVQSVNTGNNEQTGESKREQTTLAPAEE